MKKNKRLGGVELVLSNCHSDDNNSFMQQWSILAVRNITQGHAENQHFIAQLQLQSVVDDTELRRMGLDAQVDESGRISVRRQPNK